MYFNEACYIVLTSFNIIKPQLNVPKLFTDLQQSLSFSPLFVPHHKKTFFSFSLLLEADADVASTNLDAVKITAIPQLEHLLGGFVPIVGKVRRVLYDVRKG